MSLRIRQALAFYLFTCVLLHVVCGIEGRSKSRRNSRRCPNACVRRFKQLEKKQGTPGPGGPQGPQGERGPPGPALRLPACKHNEYLTSDGVNLRCVKLNLEGVCKVECKQQDRKEVEPTPSTDGKMVKFMKKNMFQRISTDAWDVEVFEIDGSLFFGLSQLGDATFQIFKWEENSFKLYQQFRFMTVRNWAPFKIGDDAYFVITSYSGTVCPIIRYDKSDQKFKNQSFGLDCRETVDLKPFKINGVQHIVVPNHEVNQPVIIWLWNGRKFVKRQEIQITATYVEAFNIGDDPFIAISGANARGPYVFLYKWKGKEFVFFQRLYIGSRPLDMAAFEAGQQEFIAVSTNSGLQNHNKVQIFRWNGKEFASFQNITSYGARRVTAMSSPLMGKQTTYLAVIHSYDHPEIYYWIGQSSTKFKKLQKIEAKSARDVSFFEMGQNAYMLMASRNNVDVFRGELV